MGHGRLLIICIILIIVLIIIVNTPLREWMVISKKGIRIPTAFAGTEPNFYQNSRRRTYLPRYSAKKVTIERNEENRGCNKKCPDGLCDPSEYVVHVAKNSKECLSY